MTIYSAVPPPPESPPAATASNVHHKHQLSNASTATVDIEAWTVSALEALSVSPIARGTGNPLSIPLDGHGNSQPPITSAGDAAPRMKLRNVTLDVDTGGATITPPRRPPSRRDSMHRRDALLKGKEGSRQRRRWENDRLVHIPNVEPPLPADWNVGPTHPVHHVPYQLAQFWDKGLRERVEERKAAFSSRRRAGTGAGSTGAAAAAGRVPRDLRATAKRTPAVKGWLRVLEEPVRRFMVERGVAVECASASAAAAAAAAAEEARGLEDNADSDDEQIVFVGRNRGSRGGGRKAAPGGGDVGQVMLLDLPCDDESAAFKRWLTHSISGYYGLESTSVSIGSPARRVVYIGIKHLRRSLPARLELPRPLWELF
ncbi:R3H-associated N-terminal domain-containing protein [Phialemonium atrogriseum]|uniref:R3H-associated N-terminal domain-containing protein n=1 Tax=Phialemonium atrogriseum TaxID=1093897 RepID=A0AAJ0C9Q1_9PEZI|nr:R3H-associated N-terminal domain-containing protein [Phialemonium atrogriseum]KAK1771513.1 R3H-associated N-terminal domain-containing protein [Phialemonium atrogriseum]